MSCCCPLFFFLVMDILLSVAVTISDVIRKRLCRWRRVVAVAVVDPALVGVVGGFDTFDVGLTGGIVAATLIWKTTWEPLEVHCRGMGNGISYFCLFLRLQGN